MTSAFEDIIRRTDKFEAELEFLDPPVLMEPIENTVSPLFKFMNV
jgi:hypothetical protein